MLALLDTLYAGGFRPPRALAPAISAELDRAIMRALAADPKERFATVREMGRHLLDLAAERTQMVWGHSFKSPGEESASRLTRSVPPTELIDRLETQPARRFRGLIFGAGFISVGVLASALISELVHSERGSLAAEPAQVVRQEAALSVAALPAPVEPPVHPATPVVVERETAAAAPPAADHQRAGRARRAERARATRRAERTAESRRAEPLGTAPASEASSAAPEATTPPPAAAAPTAPAAPAPDNGASHRRGANQSPMLD